MTRAHFRDRPGPATADELAALRRWLAAESADDGLESPRAEAALGALFAALPRPAPAPGLADRVLAEVGTSAVRTSAVVRPFRRREALHRFATGPLVERLVAALLLVAGLAVTAIAGVAGPLAGRLTTAAAIRSATEVPFGLAVVLGRWASVALELLETFFQLAGAVARAAATGPVAGSLAASLVLAALAFAILHHVFETDRSMSHAPYAHLR